MTRILTLLVVLSWALGVSADSACAQATLDSLHLGDVRAAAVSADPRSVQPELLERATRLRIEALRLGMLPQFAVSGEASIQNDVPEIGADLPGNPLEIHIPREQYRAEVQAEWSLYDGGLRGRQTKAERARLAEQRAGVQISLYAVREAATEAFFGILLMDAQHATLRLAVDDLAARLAISSARAREGATLEAEPAVIEAEMIRVRQQADEVAANRRAAMRTLMDLTGLPIDPNTPLALPELADATKLVSTDTLVDAHRPELRRLTLQSDRLRAEARTLAARTRPTLSLFGRAGIGRPSPLDFLSDAVQDYAVGGVRLRWAAFDWGRTRREMNAVRLQADLLASEQATLIRRFTREAGSELEQVRRLERALTEDDRVVALREMAADVAARQLDEGVILPDAYTTRVNDLASARLTRERHRIELARAQAHVLSTLGLFPEEDPTPPEGAVHPRNP